MVKITPRRSWNRMGVSEIIGNLLILAITVTLFSGIFWYVSSMPTPTAKTYTDFTSSVELTSSGKAWINITDKGGEPLQASTTAFYLFQDNTPISLTLSSGNITDGSFATGETWSYLRSGVSSNTSLSLMIVDVAANTIVWNSVLMGGQQAASSGPIVGDRGLTPSPTYAGNSVQFYATIFDTFGKLRTNSVFVNATSIGLGFIQLTDSNNDNVYVSGTYTANINWNGATVIFNATDSSGLPGTGRTVLVVQPSAGGSSGGNSSGPYNGYISYLNNGTYPPDATGGESGGADGITFYYIKRTSDGTITKNFTAGEGVTIELWSDTLKNTGLQNTFTLTQPVTGLAMSPPSSTAAFQIGGDYSTFREFLYNFTAPSDASIYPLSIKLKDNLGTLVSIADTISVGDKSYPSIALYKNNTGTLVPATSFNHTDALWLVIRTNSTALSSSSVQIGDIEISDYSGAYIIKKAPLSYYSSPLSPVFKTNGISTAVWGEGSSTGYYTLYINLKEAYQGWWLPNTNSYNLKISSINDGIEKFYNIDTQFNVSAPVSTTDIAAAIGSGGFTWSASGSSWKYNEIAWFQSGDQWNENVIDGNPSSGPVGIVLADINGDGRNDVVVGAQDTSRSNLFWYENENVNGKVWSSARTISMPFDAIPGTNASDGSSSTSNVNEDATVYSTRNGGFYTNGGEYVCQNEFVGSIAIADLDGDGDGDIVASFIHVVVYTTANSADNANAGNSFGMYFNRGVYVFWNDGSWTRTTLYSTDSYTSGSGTANDNANPAATVAIGDFNQDGYNDVAAVYETGATKVWLNQWLTTTGNLTKHESNAFGSASVRTLPTVPGTNPWDHVEYMPKVEVADMNGDGYPDIVRTSTSDKAVYIIYTTLSGTGTTTNVAFTGYPMTGYTNVANGTYGNLTSVDSSYQNLTETALLTAKINVTGTKTDSSPELAVNLTSDDGIYYNVTAGALTNTMSLGSFNPTGYNAGTAINSTVLRVKYSTDAAYSGGGSCIQYSFDGSTWLNTTIVPTAGQTNVVATYDLTSKGANTYGNILNLRIRFTTTDVNPSHVVKFDSLMLQVDSIQYMQLGYVYQVNNTISAYHTLTVVGHTTNASEIYHIEYSPDNDTWLDVGDITSTTDQTVQFNLTYAPGTIYWIRMTDVNHSDTVADTLCLNQLIVNHTSASVTWTSSTKIPWTAPGYITGLAIGDMKKKLNIVVANEPNDIVVTTSATSDSTALYILSQNTYGTFTPNAVSTSTMNTMCPASSYYETHGVELGDTDGDGDLDIIVVMGVQMGRDQGSAPTLWLYLNNQQMSTSIWRFTEQPISSLAGNGKSVINVTSGYIDLSVLIPMMGIGGIVVSSTLIERRSRRRK